MNFSGHNIVKTCVVTPELVGPTNNGGIGTHSFYLSKFLTEELHHDVTILLTDYITNKSISSWKKHYKSKFNIKLVHFSELPMSFNGKIHGGRWFVVHSLNIYNWLRNQDFDICHFQDLYANGFISIQAKRTGQAFSTTTLTCLMHSPSEWLREETYKFPVKGLDDLILDYMERYCIEFADFCLTHNKYMFTWAKLKGWNISNNCQVLPFILDINSSRLNSNKIDLKHIIFFCNFDKSQIFKTVFEALNILKNKFFAEEIKITFLFQASKPKFKKQIELAKKSISIYFNSCDNYESFITNGHLDTINYLTENSNALVIIPSFVNNFAATILETIELGLNVIAENTDSITEIFHNSYRLFEPNPQSLAEKIEQCLWGNIGSLGKRYSSELAKELWKDFYTSCTNTTKYDYSLTQFSHNSFEQTPLVSVCIPYFNHGRYLPQLLKSLEQQTYHNCDFEVIIVNDGSSDDLSNQVFEELQKLYGNKLWSFIKQSNRGLCKTRNIAVSKAKGRYLVFMDSDNIAKSDMIEKMVKAITFSDIDCLTCYKYGFYSESELISENYAYTYIPVGACLEAGVYEDVFGDANFIIKKEVFLQLGGFTEEKNTTYEDWEFLATLVMNGYALDVIPDYLFCYRNLESSITNSTNYFKNRDRALKPYLRNMPLWQQRLLINAVGSLPVSGNNANELGQPLTAEHFGIPPKLFKYLKLLYTKILNSSMTGSSHNFIAQTLIKFKLLIAKWVRH